MIPFIKKSIIEINAEDIEDDKSGLGFKKMIKKASVGRAGMAKLAKECREKKRRKYL